MVITFGQAKTFIEGYKDFSEVEFPFQISYKLSKLYNDLSKELNFYINELQKLIDTYAERDENGDYKYGNDQSTILIQADKIEECSTKLTELQKVTITIDDIYFNLSDFDKVTMTPLMATAIMPFIEKETQ